MTRKAFVARPGQRPAELVASDRPRSLPGRQTAFGDGPAAGHSATARKRCWREFAGAVNALMEESRYDA